MTYQAILTASIFLLVAFGIERVSKAIGIPSVIILIVTGLVGKPLLATFGLHLNGIDAAVPIIGTISLVLIVLDGALDIQLRRDPIRAAASAFKIAAGGFIICVLAFAIVAHQALNLTPFQSFILAVPFAVISSAVAIPSSDFLPPKGREFVVYESSLSDILGVLVFFSFINSDGTLRGAFVGLIGDGVLSLLLSVICSIGLALILVRVDGHVRFIPVLAGLFFLYAAGKILPLSPLIMVLLFGLTLNNPTLITRYRPFQKWLDSSYETTLNEFKVMTMELTFAVRGFFFILLGYWTDLSDLVSAKSWLGALLVLVVIYVSRLVLLRLTKNGLAAPLTWLAPRGLITVLLFLSAKEVLPLPHYLIGTVMLVVLVSASLVVMGRYRLGVVANSSLSSQTLKTDVSSP